MSRLPNDAFDFLRSLVREPQTGAPAISPEIVAQYVAGRLSREETTAVDVERARSAEKSRLVFGARKLIEDVKAGRIGQARAVTEQSPFHREVVQAWLALTVPSGPRAHSFFTEHRQFVGRVRELDELHNALAGGDNRHITVTGAAGMGKSSFVRAAVVERAALYSGGVLVVDGGSLTTRQQVLASLRSELVSGTGTDIDSVCDAIGDAHVLLVFDGLAGEQYECDVLDALHHECPNLQMLVTSRRTIGAVAESEYELGSMEMGGARPEATDAARLFEATVRISVPDYVMTPDDAALVSEIGIQVGGSPLAVVLLAGHLEPGSLAALRDQIHDRRLGFQDEAPFRDVLGSLLDALDDLTYGMALQLNIFAGLFSYADAKEVCGKNELDFKAGLDALHRHSLLRTELTSGEPMMSLRVRGLVSKDRNVASGFVAEAQERHTKMFSKRADSICSLMKYDRWVEGTKLLTRHRADFVAVTNRAISQSDRETVVRLANSLLRSYFETGRAEEFTQLAVAAMEVAEATADRALESRLLGLLGAASSRNGDDKTCKALWRRRAEIGRGTSDDRMLADTLNDLAWLAYDTASKGDDPREYETSLRYIEEAESVSRDAGIPELVATSQIIRARVYLNTGKSSEAREWIDRAADIIGQCTDMDLALYVYQSLALAYETIGEQELAIQQATTALSVAIDGEREVHIGLASSRLAALYESEGDVELAALYLLQATRAHRQVGSRHVRKVQQLLDDLQGKYGDRVRAVLDKHADIDFEYVLHSPGKR